MATTSGPVLVIQTANQTELEKLVVNAGLKREFLVNSLSQQNLTASHFTEPKEFLGTLLERLVYQEAET